DDRDASNDPRRGAGFVAAVRGDAPAGPPLYGGRVPPADRAGFFLARRAVRVAGRVDRFDRVQEPATRGPRRARASRSGPPPPGGVARARPVGGHDGRQRAGAGPCGGARRRDGLPVSPPARGGHRPGGRSVVQHLERRPPPDGPDLRPSGVFNLLDHQLGRPASRGVRATQRPGAGAFVRPAQGLPAGRSDTVRCRRQRRRSRAGIRTHPL
ncbi:MAG: COG1355, Predicted dioxygenase, partial [uncultured Phycisphaerae bacterium]